MPAFIGVGNASGGTVRLRRETSPYPLNPAENEEMNEMEQPGRDERAQVIVKIGEIVTFFVAAKVVQPLPRGYVEVVDEDGFKHEVPAHILREAREASVGRFERKLEQRTNPEAAAARSAARTRPAPTASSGPSRGNDLHERRDDRRRDFRERREQKQRGNY